MTSVQLIIEDKYELKVTSCNATQSIGIISIRQAQIEAIQNKGFKEFISRLNKNGRLLAKLKINGVDWLQGYLLYDNFSYSVTADGGVKLNIAIDDIFSSLQYASVIRSIIKEQFSLQKLLANILEECNFLQIPIYENGNILSYVVPPYASKKSKIKDFIQNGNGVTEILIKQEQQNSSKTLGFKNVTDIIGSTVNANAVNIISNGIDTLRIEKVFNNENTNLFEILIKINEKTGQIEKSSYISLGQKSGMATLTRQAYKTILLSQNSKNNFEGGSNDFNSVTTINPLGNPHLQQVLYVDFPINKTTLSQIQNYTHNRKQGLNNSFIYTINGTFQNKSGKLFEINRPVYVLDETIGIDEQMNINGIEFNYDVTNGSYTRLNLTSGKSYLNSFVKKSFVTQNKKNMKQG